MDDCYFQLCAEVPPPSIKPPTELTSHMKTLLLCTHNILLLINFNKTAIRMVSLSSSARELRTLAHCPHLAMSEVEDDPDNRAKYRPFLLDAEVEATDWIS
jgi:arsenic resistance protein ArsH